MHVRGADTMRRISDCIDLQHFGEYQTAEQGALTNCAWA